MRSRNGGAGVFIGAAHARDKDLDDIVGLEDLVGELLALVEQSLRLAEADDRIARLGDNALDGDGDNLLIVAFKLTAELTLFRLADSLAEHMLALFGGYPADLGGLDGYLDYIAGHGALLILLSLLDEQIGVGVGYLRHDSLAQINAELALFGVNIAEHDVLVVVFLFQRADEDILNALAHRVNGDAGVLAEQLHSFEEFLVLLAFLIFFFFIHFPNQSF